MTERLIDHSDLTKGTLLRTHDELDEFLLVIESEEGPFDVTRVYNFATLQIEKITFEWATRYARAIVTDDE